MATHTYLDDDPTNTASDTYTIDVTLEDVFPYEGYEAHVTSTGAGCLGFRGEARIADEELQCQPSDAYVTKFQIPALNLIIDTIL